MRWFGLDAWKPERKPRDSGGGGRPPWQLRLSLLSMVFADLVGLVLLANTSGGLFCSTITRFSGANIAIGAKIALVGGIVGMLASLVASVIAPDSPRVLSWVLLLEAATLSIAIGYVARDSAISKQTQDCGLFESDVSTSTHHVEYAYVLWGLAIVALLAQAARSWAEHRPQGVGAASAAIVSVAVLVAVLPGIGATKGRRSAAKAAGPPKGVLVCRAFPAPKALGGPQCVEDVDVGRAPIRRPASLECSTALSDVKGKTIGIQVFYGGRLIKHANIRSSDSETSPYAYFDSSDVDSLTTSSQLPIGHYRRRFLVNGKIARDRTVNVGRLPFASAP